MIALIQRVTHAHVDVDGITIGRIEQGILALIGIEKGDTQAHGQRLFNKMINYRIFADEADRMNLNLSAVDGGLLLVPQFTLAADTSKGTKPSFSSAAPPELGKQQFDALVAYAKSMQTPIETGKFGADMKVHLLNDGPVTFWLQS